MSSPSVLSELGEKSFMSLGMEFDPAHLAVRENCFHPYFTVEETE